VHNNNENIKIECMAPQIQPNINQDIHNDESTIKAPGLVYLPPDNTIV